MTKYIFETTEDIGTLDMSSKKYRYLGRPDYNLAIFAHATAYNFVNLF